MPKKSILTLIALLFVVALVATGFFFLIPSSELELSSNSDKSIRYYRCENDHLLKSHSIQDKTLICGTFYTEGLQKWQSESAGFALVFMIFKTNSKNSSKSNELPDSKEALVYIPGGPGEGFQTNDEKVLHWLDWLAETEITQDLLVFDPRGVGHSRPRLECKEYDEYSLNIAGENSDVDEESRVSLEILDRCFEKNTLNLARRGEYASSNVFGKRSGSDKKQLPKNSLSLFSSQQQAADITSMMRALQYPSWHLMGVSYGTRVALAAAHADEVKTLILDSVYPFNKGRITEWPALYVNAMGLHERLYSTKIQSVQQNEYDSFEELFNSVIAELDKTPIEYSIETWEEESRTIELVLNKYRLASLAYYVLYDETLYMSFYQGLEDFLNGDKETLRFVLESFVTSSFDTGFSSTVFYATECTDNALVKEEQFNRELARFPNWNWILKYGWEYDPCRSDWFSGDHTIHNLGYADVPSLIFTGEFDPVTPVSWGNELDAELKTSRHIVAPETGHAVLWSGVCESEFIAQFLDNKDLSIPIDCRANSSNEPANAESENIET